MPAHERLTAAIIAANDDNRPALVPFITAGYPEPGEFINTLKAVAEVGDVELVQSVFPQCRNADGNVLQAGRALLRRDQDFLQGWAVLGQRDLGKAQDSPGRSRRYLFDMSRDWPPEQTGFSARAQDIVTRVRHYNLPYLFVIVLLAIAKRRFATSGKGSQRRIPQQTIIFLS